MLNKQTSEVSHPGAHWRVSGENQCCCQPLAAIANVLVTFHFSLLLGNLVCFLWILLETACLSWSVARWVLLAQLQLPWRMAAGLIPLRSAQGSPKSMTHMPWSPSLGRSKYTPDLMKIWSLFPHEDIHHSLILTLSFTSNLPFGVIFLFVLDADLLVVNALGILHFILSQNVCI